MSRRIDRRSKAARIASPHQTSDELIPREFL
jgi:hypothetical protein